MAFVLFVGGGIVWGFVVAVTGLADVEKGEKEVIIIVVVLLK